ncbi:hypothetical protein EJ05DRAFT_346721 [Pseudovirgaria hyperparasitica]|uniref:C3H1-type domain-containing protein n=1 Tax=Pseudovirgaria hyperparasitica TaxID=470096 RepID=A0A6A6W9N9_9PEZI|nr:uncharacterized protein EJ05DRAFT_346721 [Pseudovirgaria hyperparasitica]KAF2758307.1 hypothetical protein EJ05DRAFT_346721 [Pseudovirgaria hyperparasitica]
MASNHVHLDNFHTQQAGSRNSDSNTPQLYSNTQDLAGYTNFYGDAPYTVSYNLPDSQPAAAHGHTNVQLHSWQQQQHQQPHQQPPGQQQHYSQNAINPAFNNQALYGRSFSNSPVPYREGIANDARRGFAQPTVDPSLVSGSAHTNYGLPISSYSQLPPHGSIAPSVLQAHNTYASSASTPPVAYQQPINGVQPYQLSSGSSHGQGVNGVQLRTDFDKPPRAKVHGMFLIIDDKELEKATGTVSLDEFVHIGNEPVELNVTRTTIPQYVPRKSRKELKLLASGNKSLLDRITRRPAKQSKSSNARVRISPHSSALSRKSTGSPIELSDASDSSSDGSYDDSSDDEETSPLPGTRPSGALDSVRYDTIKAVWLSRRDGAQAERIRTALGDYWDLIRTIKDRWKKDSDAVKEAEEKKRLGEIDLLKDRVQIQRGMLEMALRSALENGHPEVIRLLGQNKAFLFVCYSFLAERVKEKDYTSSLGNTIIEMLTSTTSLSIEMMEETKLAKALTLFARKGDDRMKAKIKTIEENAANVSKQKVKASTPISDQTSGSKDAIPKLKPEQLKRINVDAAYSTKRRAEGDGGQPAKRILSGSGMSTASGAVASTAKSAQKRQLSSAATVEKATSYAISATMGKPKVVAKSSPTYVLQSASKKPSVSTIAKKSQPMSVTSKKPTTTAPQKPAFSFSDTMANLLKPKDSEPTTKQEDKRPPETAEEKAKRLRKEERRKLRVTWKPDAALCSIKYFEHDPDEDFGHDASMVRNAGSVHEEGRMFKQKHKEMMDNDEEEEIAPEQNHREWKIPSAIDFDVFDQSIRSSNFIPYGGGTKIPVSPDKEAQEQYEANNLMVYYHDPADIPPTPREPNEFPSEDSIPVVEFGVPLEWTLRRAVAFQPQQAQPPLNNGTLTQDLSAILDSLKSHQSQSTASQSATTAPLDLSYQPPIQPVTQLTAQAQNNSNHLSQLLSSFAPPVAQANPAPDIHAFLGNLFAQAQPQPQPSQSTFSSASQGLPFANPSHNDPQALLASLMSQMPANIQTQQQLPQYHDQQYDDFKRKRNDNGDRRELGKKPKWDPENPPNKFTKPCDFFLIGKCRKGDKCTYRHEK